MKILVTGGAGFIGSHFVDYVLKKTSQDSEIIVVDKLTYAGSLTNLESAFTDARVKFLKLDICEVGKYQHEFQDVTHIVNFAAESHVDRSIENSEDFVRTNIQGTNALLNLAVKVSANKFVQISTDEVYGSISNGSWDENCILSPNSPYAASKAAADLLVKAFWKTHELNVNITRCSNNYGERQYPEKLIPYFVKLLSEGKNVPVYGDGLNSRDWLHVADHCKAIWLVLNEGQPGEIYNIGGGEEYRNIDLIHLIIDAIPNTSNSQIEFVEDRKGHDFRYSVNWKKIQDNLGYQPSEKFEQKFVETVLKLHESYRVHLEKNI